VRRVLGFGDSPVEYVLLVNLAATLFMVGGIWFVQLVHYPLFPRVVSEGVILYSKAHSRLTACMVGPQMLVEAATTLLLVFRRPEGLPLATTLIGLVLVTVVRLSTGLLQVPRHTVFSGFDQRVWSALGALVLWISARAIY